MESVSLYKDIAERTNGDIYIGVVGPVRAGKSTFIKRLMDIMILPRIDNIYSRERARDELPQSGSGRTITTTEPKFVPNEAIEIQLDENVKIKARFIDCVGYLIQGAIGHEENDMPRMVSTPWHTEKIPFENAAEIGTKKVINEHSTIGVVITTDGSFGEIGRENYLGAEERVIRELLALRKPFITILNSARPNDEKTKMIAQDMERKFNIPVLPMDCAAITLEDVNFFLEKVLYEFPAKEIKINLPSWFSALNKDNVIRKSLYGSIKEAFANVKSLREAKDRVGLLKNNDLIKRASLDAILPGTGSVNLDVTFPESLFYGVLSEFGGMVIENDFELVNIIKDYSSIKTEYDKILPALMEVKEKGYGVVMPGIEEMELEEPEIIRQGNRFGVRLKAAAPSIHMIKANIETEIAPLVGTEKQSEELLSYLLTEFEGRKEKIWESNIFGKSLHELVVEGLNNKITKMTEDSQSKIQETLQKIINEGAGGLICIII